jgi:hypothetical protein
MDLLEIAATNYRVVLTEDKLSVILQDDQKAAILELWKNETPPSMDDMMRAAFGVAYDNRSKPAQIIKKFLAEHDIKPKKFTPFVNKVVLTDEQKEYIKSHCLGVNAEPLLDAVRVLFDNKNLSPVHNEYVESQKYLTSIMNEPIKEEVTEEVIDKEYKPAKSLMQAAARVNKFVFKDTIKDRAWEPNVTIRKNLESLIKFTHYPRFLLLCRRYLDLIERDLFEGTYVAYVWDKTDLTAEELDLYIDVCQDVVAEVRIENELSSWTRKMSEGTTDDEGKRISPMVIGEHLANLRDESNKNKERRKKMVENLQGKRSTRIENKMKQTASMLNLVEAWKNQENRNKILKDAEERKRRVGEEIKRLTGMESLRALVAGVHPEEILR